MRIRGWFAVAERGRVGEECWEEMSGKYPLPRPSHVLARVHRCPVRIVTVLLYSRNALPERSSKYGDKVQAHPSSSSRIPSRASSCQQPAELKGPRKKKRARNPFSFQSRHRIDIKELPGSPAFFSTIPLCHRPTKLPSPLYPPTPPPPCPTVHATAARTSARRTTTPGPRFRTTRTAATAAHRRPALTTVPPPPPLPAAQVDRVAVPLAVPPAATARRSALVQGAAGRGVGVAQAVTSATVVTTAGTQCAATTVGALLPLLRPRLRLAAAPVAAAAAAQMATLPRSPQRQHLPALARVATALAAAAVAGAGTFHTVATSAGRRAAATDVCRRTPTSTHTHTHTHTHHGHRKCARCKKAHR